MKQRLVMLVDDNPDDVVLAQRAFSKCGVSSKMLTAHDGVEALQYLFGEGEGSERSSAMLPQ